MKLIRLILISFFCAFVLPGMVFAYDITVDASNVSVNISAEHGWMGIGAIATYDFAEGPHLIYSNGSGRVANFNVEADGTVSYDLTYDGKVFTGYGTSTITVVGHPITLDGTDLDVTITVVGCGNSQYTDYHGSITLYLPANIERLQDEYYKVHQGISGGYIAYFNIEADGTVSYDTDAYEPGVFSGIGTNILKVIGHPITLDGTGIDTKVTVGGTTLYTDNGGSRIISLPANVERVTYPYIIYSYGGGYVGKFDVGSSGLVSYDSTYEGGVLTGDDTSTLTIVGHEITIDASQVDTELYERHCHPSFGIRQFDGTVTYKLPANVDRRPSSVDQYEVFSRPGGKIALFNVAADGTVYYDAEYDGIITAVDSTIVVPGHEITIDGHQVDTEIYEYYFRELDSTINDYEAIYRLPANPYYNVGGNWSPYTLLSAPGGRVAFFQVEPDGTVFYDGYYNGVVSGTGTSTVTVLGHPIIIDGTQVETELYVYTLDQKVGKTQPGGTLTYNLPANPKHGSWGPYQLHSSPGGRVAVFQVDPFGTVSYEEGYEDTVLPTGATLTALAYNLIIDATDVDSGDGVYIYKLEEKIVTGGSTREFKLPANPKHSSFGAYVLYSSIVGRLRDGDPAGVFDIFTDGTFSKNEFVYANGTVRLYSEEPDPDSDGDGTPDSIDGCPYDPNKTAPGDCGCGTDDIDTDGDGTSDCIDTCPQAYNPDQSDFDEDGLGDACDNCPGEANPGQEDGDNDGIGNACDNCPLNNNPDQADEDGDSVGDVCDICYGDDNLDIDIDGQCDASDNCPTVENSSQEDYDGDDVGDACDNCPGVYNQDQFNLDGDDFGDACDNCPTVINDDQANNDNDDFGDVCDDDDDNDNVLDTADNCPLVPNPNQEDFDSDGQGDVCDGDDDGDGISDGGDQCPATEVGAIVDVNGCSGEQLVDLACPCDGDWKNHGKYVSCVAQAAEGYIAAGLISESEKGDIVSERAKSGCGKKK